MSGRPPRAPDGLADYRRKRSAGATPEPPGGTAEADVGRPGRFVVQQHAARRLHWDLRLEIDGVLRSWAVPHGPSLDPAEKRLAVETEAHPVEYFDFEGVIPAGNYGAGPMIVWDRGLWVPKLDPAEGPRTGKYLFELRGYKLRGLWTLVRTGRRGDPEPRRDWLLIKKPDAWATGEAATDLPAGSVLSGLTVGELAAAAERAPALGAELDAAGAPRRELALATVEPMLAAPGGTPFRDDDWWFELKYDGYRLLAGTGRAVGEAAGPAGRRRVELRYRSGREATATYPDLARALAALPYDGLVLDGEVVVLDDEARPSFQRLQRRALLSRPGDVARAALELPAVYFVFDLLAAEGRDLRGLPLAERKRLLAPLLPAAGPVRFADHLVGRGDELFAAARAHGLEGLIAKRAAAPYRAGRGDDWRKLRADLRADFVVVGFTRAAAGEGGLGALHLGWMDGPRLVYAGRVGSGLAPAGLADLRRRLEALARPDPPLSPPAEGEAAAPSGPEHRWVEPRLVASVRYREVTGAGQLRQPVFLELRGDRRPADCLRPAAAGRPEEPPPAPPAPPRRGRWCGSTHPDKVFWPDAGITKGDLAAYYRAVAPWLLPYLRDRPVVLDRYPDGIDGKSFFQKHAPEPLPEGVRTVAVWSEEAEREIRYFVCDDEESLLYLVNLATIPLHVWSSRVGSLQAPDWCILDLDAKDAPFSAVVRVARALGRLCRELGLEAAIKTSGATGLHVLLPLGGAVTHEASRQLAELLARVVVGELPEDASVARLPQARAGKVYVDYLQNGYGKLLVAPYSVRPRPGAPVSMPLRWREVGPRLDPARFTLRSAPGRLRRRDADPLRGVLGPGGDLRRALERLAARL